MKYRQSHNNEVVMDNIVMDLKNVMKASVVKVTHDRITLNLIYKYGMSLEGRKTHYRDEEFFGVKNNKCILTLKWFSNVDQ
jgi:ABC-type transporter Mla maintaining outer membrane lipid asymmetry ATPase subunit MlaF